MYPITNDVKALFESEQRQALRITGTDKNGVAINITDADIIIDSFNIDRYSCNGEKLEIGTAIASEMTLKLDNFDGRFNDIVFEGTELFVEIGIYDEEHTGWHWIPCGYFTPDEQPRSLSTISIHALDRMTRFDAVSPVLTPWTDENGNVMTDNNGQVIYFAADVTLPVLVTNLVNQICIRCQIPFTQNMSGIPNWSLQIDEIPVLQQEITFRNLIQWCAGIMGCNAWIDWTGSLRFSWYSATTDYTCTPANRYSSDLYEDDITITGVTYTNTKNATLISGSADYAVDMTGNYLAASKITQILVNVKNYISGYTYRPFSASVINAPYLWPMDRITFTDKDGNNHACAVTNVSFGINGTTALAGKGETAQTNSGTAPSGVTTEQGFLIERAAEVTREFDESLTQEEIFNRLTDNGEEQGLILYNGKLYLNASYISAGTVSADILKGGVLKLGGENNVNGVFEMYNAQGVLTGRWDNSNLSANGSLALNGNAGSTMLFNMGDDGYFKIDSRHVEMVYSPNSYPLYVGFGYIPFGDISNVYYPIYVGSGASANESYNRVIITPDSISMTYGPHDYTQTDVFLVTENHFKYRGSDAFFYGNFYVYDGTKSRVVSTDQYADRLLYCYETPSPMFGDVGEGTIGEDGRCYVWLDPVFAQTITTTQYQVFLQPYGDGKCYVSERKGGYFVVEGTPGLAFGWELKAKQKDFDQRRLENAEQPYQPERFDYGAAASTHIDEIKKERAIA